MSLINEALKKAQRERSGAESKVPFNGPLRRAPAPMPVVAPGKKPIGFFKIILCTIAGAAVFGVAVALLVLNIIRGGGGMEPEGKPVAAVSAPVSTPSIPSAPRENEVAPAALKALQSFLPAPPEKQGGGGADSMVGKVENAIRTGNAEMESIEGALEERPVSKPATNPSPAPTRPPRPATRPPPQPVAKPVVVSPAPAPVSRPLPSVASPRHKNVSSPSQPNPATAAFVEAMIIRGIKLAGANSRVLTNNKVYRINSVVNEELSLRILRINPQQIIFIDDAGFKYYKSF